MEGDDQTYARSRRSGGPRRVSYHRLGVALHQEGAMYEMICALLSEWCSVCGRMREHAVWLLQLIVLVCYVSFLLNGAGNDK